MRSEASFRRALKPVFVACFLLFTAGGARAESAEGSWRKVSPSDWQSDLHYFAARAPVVHKNLFHTMTRAQFDSAVRSLDDAIPILKPNQILVRFMALAALIQDGHSSLDIGDLRLPQVPMRFRQFEDGIYVTAADPAYAKYVGGRLLEVGPVASEKAMRDIAPLVPHDPDNDGEVRTWAARNYLSVPTILNGLGLSGSDRSANYTIESHGIRETVTLTADVIPAEFSLESFTLDPVPADWVLARASGNSTSLADTHPDRIFWFEPIPAHNALYVELRGMIDERGHTLSDFAKEIDDYLASHPVGRVIVDVRANSGGDNTLIRPLLISLIKFGDNQRGRLWVLISHRTFSADQNFINRLESYAEPIFVGEPTAQNVNFFGDPRPVELPHSHFSIVLSSLWWQDKDPRDHRTRTSPEIAVTPTISELTSGRDRALEIALSEPAPETLVALMKNAASKGPEAVRMAHDAFVSDPRHRFVLEDDERQLNNAGYQELARQDVTGAVAIFQVNCDVHPNSTNAFESLGEGLEAAGHSALAKSAYQHSLVLDASNGQAKDALLRLGQ